MSTFVILSEKVWHEELYSNLNDCFPEFKWVNIKTKNGFNLEYLNQLNPEKIFIPHWSHIIPEKIYESFECVVFHMTDLPFGRGGSPLQNLIVRGHKETKISALKVDKGIDTGPIYLKEPLTLSGTAEEIFVRASSIIERMIIKIIQNGLSPVPQKGDITIFKRRRPEDSNIDELQNIEQIYDHIRMLDSDGYPSAFLEFGDFKLEFSKASMKSNNQLIANVRITKK